MDTGYKERIIPAVIGTFWGGANHLKASLREQIKCEKEVEATARTIQNSIS